MGYNKPFCNLYFYILYWVVYIDIMYNAYDQYKLLYRKISINIKKFVKKQGS